MPTSLASLDGSTIAALATPPGRGALAVVRVSGPGAHAIAERVLRPWPIAARRATLCAVHEPGDGGVLLDRAVVTRFEAPGSYTGEDAVEVTTHGGAQVPAAVLAAFVDAGARPALPGEFTRRAVLNGRLDLVQAEAVGDLIDARSGAMHRAALAQLDGGLSRRVAALREGLLDLEALLAYDIDFPEEDEGPVAPARVTASAQALLGALDALLATAPAGALVRDGATVVIAGAPNAGKSSLFNALLGERRAIVTAVPGTTRDAIEAVLDTHPFPLRLVDTAGLRESADVVERLGIEVSERYLARAELVLACGEGAAAVGAAAARVRALTAAPVVGVWTKADLAPAGADGRGGPPPNTTIAPSAPPSTTDSTAVGTAAPATSPIPILPVSAETGAGLSALVAHLLDQLARRHGATAESGAEPLVMRVRHRQALTTARAELAAFAEAWERRTLPAPVAAVHVRAAIGALEELIGAVDVEEVLGRVFSTFCVGK